MSLVIIGLLPGRVNAVAAISVEVAHPVSPLVSSRHVPTYRILSRCSRIDVKQTSSKFGVGPHVACHQYEPVVNLRQNR